MSRMSVPGTTMASHGRMPCGVNFFITGSLAQPDRSAVQMMLPSRSVFMIFALLLEW